MSRSTLLTGFTAVLAALVGNAAGETVTVTTQADAVDIDTATATIDDLPGPDGEVSFSEALITTNNTPGHQTIEFDVPMAGKVLITSITGFYFRAYESVTVDASMQLGGVGIWSHELYFLADDCTLIGFDETEVFFTGANGLARDNTGYMDITVSGSGSRIENNLGGTITLNQASDSVVVGNTVQRLRVLGGSNNVIGGPAPEDRNHFTGYGYWNSSGLPSGTTMQLAGTVGTVIENNTIGTTPDGLAQGNPACSIGISFEGSNEGVVVRDNLIGGIRATGIGTWAGYQFGYAVIFWGTGGSNIELTGNTIGLDANGDPVLGSVWGISVGDVNGAGPNSDVRIGGALPGQGNVIAGHILNGVTIGREASAVRMAGNEIYDNGWLGIDLIPTGYGYGVTPNDPLDPDTGGNGLQNFPELASATRAGSSIHVVGTLNSTPADDFTVELFASPACDDDGFGEGQVFLGATSVTTDGGGDASFDVLLTTAVPDGWVISSTATLEPVGATSEFSACIPLEGGSMPGDADGDGIVDVADLVKVILEWGPCDSSCPSDLDGNGVVDVEDLVMVITHWS